MLGLKLIHVSKVAPEQNYSGQFKRNLVNENWLVLILFH